ncbi:MAG: hypothetical protein IPJ88_12705 [Myxococcales bacterium]|nr:MAG: hypothetical protein IPJ88_12705 [Myxococcales bacterium]
MSNQQRPRPGKLSERVVEQGFPQHVFGYALEDDLVLYYGFTEIVFLYLTGELPTSEKAKAFDTAMMLQSPISVREAPAHAAMLARLMGSHLANVTGIGSVALTEWARSVTEQHQEFLEWLNKPNKVLPACAYSDSSDSRQYREMLVARLAKENISIATLERSLSAEAARLAVFHWAGLVLPDQMLAALVVARLPCAIAQALSHLPSELMNYPANMPEFQYER